MRLRYLALLSIGLALLYALGIMLDWSEWLHRSVAWEWGRQPPSYFVSRYWVLAGLFIAWLFLLFLVARPDIEWTRWRNALLVTAAVILSLVAPLVIASQKRSQPLSIAFLRTVHSTSGFYEESTKLDNPQTFIQEHISRMPGYRGIHLSTQPPGWPIAFWAVGRGWQHLPQAADSIAHRLRRANCTAYDLQGLLPAQISAALLQMGILIIGALGAAPVYLLARDEYSSQVARISSVVYVLIPGLLVFQASFDVLYAVCAITALWLLRKAFVDSLTWTAVLLAAALAVISFFAFGPLSFILLLNVYMLSYAWLWRRSWRAFRRILIINSIIFLAIAITWTSFWLLWRVSWVEMFLRGQQIHRAVRGTQPLWPMINLYDLAVFMGIPLLIWALSACVVAFLRINRPREGDALALSWLTFVLILNLSGTVRAEAGRLWLFVMPIGAIVAVAFWAESWQRFRPRRLLEDEGNQVHAPSRLLPVLLILVFVSFGIQGIVSGLYLGDTLPLDASPEAVWSLPKSAESIYYELGDTIALRGYTLRESEREDLVVTLYWQALDRTRADYSVFVHALNEEGEPVAQADGGPIGGALPTWCWVKSEVVADTHLLSDVTLEGDPLHIGVGIYDWRTGTRIPVTPTVADNMILLPRAP